MVDDGEFARLQWSPFRRLTSAGEVVLGGRLWRQTAGEKFKD